MFRVIVGTVTVANLPDRQRAEYFTKRFGGIIKRNRYKNPKFINYLKEDKTGGAQGFTWADLQVMVWYTFSVKTVVQPELKLVYE